MATYLTSDTHFGDHRTINISRRPFASSAEVDAAIVERWNAVVGTEDEVWAGVDDYREVEVRGPVWWDDGSPGLNRHRARNAGYAGWFARLEDAT